MINIGERLDKAQAAAEHGIFYRWPRWPLRRRRTKDYADLLGMVDDPEFWAGWIEKLKPLLDEVFGIIFRAGADAGLNIEPATKELLPLDPDAINRAFDRTVSTYTDEWWRQFQQSTQGRMRDAIRRAQEMGTGVEGVIEDLEPLFGTQRAMTIAATETTRLFGLGAQAAYAAAGLDEWEWQTVEDGFVCAVCREVNKTRHPISVPFRPAHPRCRCFPRPVVAELEGPPQPARRRRPRAGETDVTEPEVATPDSPTAYPKTNFKTRQEVERWLRNKYPDKTFGFAGINVDSVNEIAREYDRLATAFPHVNERLQYFGSNTSKPKELRYRAASSYVAYASVDGKVIVFNSAYYKSAADYRDMMKRNFESKWFPDIKDDVPPEWITVSHEWGHQVDHWIQGQRATVNGYMRVSGFGSANTVLKAWRETYNREGRKVSRYAQSNQAETWAESFATGQHGTASAQENLYVAQQKKLIEALGPGKLKPAPAGPFGMGPQYEWVGDIKDDKLRAKINQELLDLASHLGIPLDKV